MALGLVGRQGQFSGKQLDKMMFLGELSLDGSVRSVRGALSAALAVREFGLKSLPQAVDLVNSRESFTPVKVDAQQMLSEAAQYSVDLRDVHEQQARLPPRRAAHLKYMSDGRLAPLTLFPWLCYP